jgi:hypothetical protein
MLAHALIFVIIMRLIELLLLNAPGPALRRLGSLSRPPLRKVTC